MSQLDRNDIAALNSTVDVVLNTRDDGQTARWTRPAAGNHAEVNATLTPEGTTIKQQRTCRFIAVTVHAGVQTVKLRPQYCRTATTSWELQGAQ
ncbi:MAG TPA: hypothetical protein VJS30_24865 [Paraburkholderia sp.]|nr:hypothetical protein [Paraburkholderia sp.]